MGIVIYIRDKYVNSDTLVFTAEDDIFLRMLEKYRNCKTDENRKYMVKARSDYKTLLRKCRFSCDKERTKTIVNAKVKNAKMYWNMLKE